MKVEEMKQAFVMKYRLIAFDKDGKRRCNEEDMLIGIDEICEAVIAEKSPSNEQIHEAALAWARDHSEAPDKDCPTWLSRDYEAGAYFVRQCMGCWNKTEPDKSEVDKMVDERMRDELIKYDRWMSGNYWDVKQIPTPEQSVDEYLKSRER